MKKEITLLLAGVLSSGMSMLYAQDSEPNRAKSITVNGTKLEGFSPDVYTYENLEVTNGRFPTVAVMSDVEKTTKTLSYNEAENSVTIVVTDNAAQPAQDYTYTLKFLPFDKVMNGSQIKGDFEVQTPWGPDFSSKVMGTVADGWASSNVLQMEFMKFVMVEKEAHELGGDSLAVKMVNGRPGMGTLASNAPGYITLGETWVYADMTGLISQVTGDKSDPDDSDGGSNGGVNFTFMPDSITGLFKRTLDKEAEFGNTEEKAYISAYLWKGTASSMADATSGGKTGESYQLLIDREKDVLESKNGATLVAKAEYNVEGELTDWTRITIPVEYVSDEAPEKLNVIISAADYFNRANIGQGNTLSADNVAFVYNSQLQSLAVAGTAVEGFDKNTYSYNVRLAEVPSAESVEAVADGRGATVETAIDEQNSKITVTVKGNDIAENAENMHQYVISYELIGVEHNYSFDNVSASYDGSCLHISGKPAGAVTEIYTADGVKVAASAETVIPVSLRKGNVYIVRTGSKAIKVVAE